VCYGIGNTDSTPSRDSLFSAIEDGVLKRLAVWLDDEAQAKNLASKLSEENRASSPASDIAETAGRAEGTPLVDVPHGCPLLLRRSIENLHWRREEQSHKRIAIQLSAQGDGTRRLDEASQTLLRQAAEFHQRRANKKAPT